MSENKLQFTTLATFSDFESTLNPSFHKARLRIMALDKKARNGAVFSREGAIEALPTLKNVPLVTQYNTQTGNLKSHEFESDGNALTYGIGVVSESCQQWLEEVEVDGETVEYLCSEVLLWKRQKREYEFIKRHKELNVSMEVMMNNPKQNKKAKTIDVDNFYFTAITVLGVGVNPAFGEANIVFSEDTSCQQMLFELNEFENGGNTMPQDNQQVVEPVNNEQTPVEPTEPTTQVEPTVEPPQVAEPTNDINQEPQVEEDKVDYKSKYEQLEAELSRTIVDLQKERDSLTSQLQAVQQGNDTEITSLKQELEELRNYKAQIENEKLQGERQAILTQFEDLKEAEEYEELVKELDKYTPSQLEDKLYIISGRIAREEMKRKKQQQATTKHKINITTPVNNQDKKDNIQYGKFLLK